MQITLLCITRVFDAAAADNDDDDLLLSIYNVLVMPATAVAPSTLEHCKSNKLLILYADWLAEYLSINEGWEFFFFIVPLKNVSSTMITEGSKW